MKVHSNRRDVQYRSVNKIRYIVLGS